MSQKKTSVPTSQNYDVCIVGAGVAGSILAAQLTRFNYRIIVIEKNFKLQKKISGELLQPAGVACLKAMGMGFLLEGIDAQRVEGYTLHLGNEYFSIPYDRSQNLFAYSFKNSLFVEQARNHIRGLPQVDLVEGNVNQLLTEGKTIKGVNFITGGESVEINASLTFVCEGAVSKLSQYIARENKKKSGFFIGLLLTDCELPVAHYGHVILSGESPILIYPVSSHEKRILIDFPVIPKMGHELCNYLKENIRPHLPDSVLPAFDQALLKSNFMGMPNHNLRSYPLKNKKNIALVGDCFNMRHPLTGGGMSAVFNDIRNITTLIAEHPDLNQQRNIDRIISTYYEIRVRDVANINILADSLYRATIDPHLKVASFNYLKKDVHGENTIRILAGIDKKKFNLIKHFARVVTDGVNKLSLDNKKKIRLLAKASRIVVPLLLQEGNTKFHRWGNRLLDKFIISPLDESDKKLSKKKQTSP